MGSARPQSLKPDPASVRNQGEETLDARDESDETLMLRFCDGDSRAFEQLFQRHAGAIQGYLVHLVGATVAADLTQASFLSVVRARGRFDRSARFKPWLYAIATNAARDFRRRRRPDELTSFGDLPDVPVRPRQETQADERMQARVHSAIQQLPENQKVAIVMHRFQDLSFAEIAEALGVSESAVKVRAHRGYKRLRELLRSLWESQ